MADAIDASLSLDLAKLIQSTTAHPTLFYAMLTTHAAGIGNRVRSTLGGCPEAEVTALQAFYSRFADVHQALMRATKDRDTNLSLVFNRVEELMVMTRKGE